MAVALATPLERLEAYTERNDQRQGAERQQNDLKATLAGSERRTEAISTHSIPPLYALLGIPREPTFSARKLTTASGPSATCIPVGIAAVLMPGTVSLAIL